MNESYPGGMPVHDVVEIVTAVADALDFAHEHRLLHRDVKPENILVTTPDGRRRRVLLTDFGIARRIDDVGNLTDDNVAVGTVNYMAPEQLRGQSLDGRADQYALAATTFHLLTGAPPFHDANRAVVIGRHLATPPPRISERRPELAYLDGVLARALAKDPDERYPTCLDFAHALTRPGSTRRRRHPTGKPSGYAAPRTSGPSGDSTRRQASAADARDELGTLSFHVTPGDPADNLPAAVPVEIRTQHLSGQLSDGDPVEVSGVWDGRTLDADKIAIFPGDGPAKATTVAGPCDDAGNVGAGNDGNVATTRK